MKKLRLTVAKQLSEQHQNIISIVLGVYLMHKRIEQREQLQQKRRTVASVFLKSVFTLNDDLRILFTDLIAFNSMTCLSRFK